MRSVQELDHKLKISGLNMFYGDFKVLEEIDLDIPCRHITSLIGPSPGCGKSSLLRCLNRMNDLVEGCRVEGSIRFDGDDIISPDYDVIDLRRRGGHGLPAAQPPFPKSIYENVAFTACACEGSRASGDLDRTRVGEPASGPLCGTRSSDKSEAVRPWILRAAAAPVHRPRAGGTSRR